MTRPPPGADRAVWWLGFQRDSSSRAWSTPWFGQVDEVDEDVVDVRLVFRTEDDVRDCAQQHSFGDARRHERVAECHLCSPRRGAHTGTIRRCG